MILCRNKARIILNVIRDKIDQAVEIDRSDIITACKTMGKMKRVEFEDGEIEKYISIPLIDMIMFCGINLL